MKKPLFFLSLLMLCCTSLIFCQQDSEEDLLEPHKVSKALGHSFARNLMETPGFHFKIDSVVEGMQDAMAGRPSPLTEAQYEKAFDIIQQRYLEEMSSANLNQANDFLEKNLNEKNIVELIPGKLQMAVIKEGSGEKVIEESTIPVVKYSGKYLDETSFGKSDEPLQIQMDQTFPGIRQGLIGAKKGEQRRLFIHPELSHSQTDLSFPNSLMILDITVLDTDSELKLDDSAE